MPFMKGTAPIRRTLQYLDAGTLILRDSVRIFSVNYLTEAPHSEGLRRFVFWHLAQLQYKNPSVQVIVYKNICPTPFIKCYLSTKQEILLDCFDRTKSDVESILHKVIGKPVDLSKASEAAVAQQVKSANFGREFSSHCMCEHVGQVPCSSFVSLPPQFRGKTRRRLLEEGPEALATIQAEYEKKLAEHVERVKQNAEANAKKSEAKPKAKAAK